MVVSSLQVMKNYLKSLSIASFLFLFAAVPAFAKCTATVSPNTRQLNGQYNNHTFTITNVDDSTPYYNTVINAANNGGCSGNSWCSDPTFSIQYLGSGSQLYSIDPSSSNVLTAGQTLTGLTDALLSNTASLTNQFNVFINQSNGIYMTACRAILDPAIGSLSNATLNEGDTYTATGSYSAADPSQ
ncbi:MAG TPA: hypothetical protein VEP90_26490, partial [Methylomirabilota bacterium]|nr:hypothetical protein [Methylomirabilota bacterium]